MTLAERLRELMSEKGWSETELSRRAHVPQPTVHRIARGDTGQPRRETVTRLAKALGVSAEWLWSGSIPFTSSEQEILEENELRELDIEDKERQELENEDLEDFDPRQTELQLKLTDSNGLRRGYSIRPCIALEGSRQKPSSLQQLLLKALSDDLGYLFSAAQRSRLVKITLEFEDPLTHSEKVERILKIRRR
ncbi:TPA: helix-turn-helix domain-containing protein [Pseudomonas aeruginosa]|uniref:helix-turn-helix domain-containing protein n=1 Tax=Pseudomonas aeruginosa TaxID=287 RepID=UPI000936C074|nr:helix-turn-helix transcriptional regulator [Pseudomonas aeruginosa]MCS9066108.1 helix-turn-helix domain-containing protein [Pseudomonas aeruginosa]MCS9542522.1 helix-turn-helix domain-containing protein [Pseudomonas aeruginosa]MCT0591861.1 helix-turn-helix domain-containing protein [Pseudomonas aeruginosa]MCT5034923.1 helix-turn-helix domain-containing protein [Pseudomonas aeruginosa]MCV6433520.1 helix-turn-helix domain-containing protein [Pseudomonas aeruginosa]